MNAEHVSWRRPWDDFKTQKQWKSYIQDLIGRSDAALKRAIVQIYERQTYEEQLQGSAIAKNEVGFSKIDAKVLGDIAKKIKAGKELTEAETAKSRNKMKKYWKQLMNISLENERKLIRSLPVSAFQEDQHGIVFDDKKESCVQFEHACSIMNDCMDVKGPCEYRVCHACPAARHQQLVLPLYGEEGVTNEAESRQATRDSSYCRGA